MGKLRAVAVWRVALLVALLGVLSTAWGQMVEGRVESLSSDRINVGGTIFQVDDDTVVQPSPDSPGRTVPYAGERFDDVWKVRVTGTGRLAQRIVILPYRAEGREER